MNTKVETEVTSIELDMAEKDLKVALRTIKNAGKRLANNHPAESLYFLQKLAEVRSAITAVIAIEAAATVRVVKEIQVVGDVASGDVSLRDVRAFAVRILWDECAGLENDQHLVLRSLREALGVSEDTALDVMLEKMKELCAHRFPDDSARPDA